MIIPTFYPVQLSISEYRKRKQQSTGSSADSDQTNDATVEKSAARGRSDSASSGTSSLSSDEENTKVAADVSTLTTLPLFVSPEGDDKKGTYFFFYFTEMKIKIYKSVSK